MVEKQFFSNLIGSTCPYCQHKIEAGQGLTICPECSTPHHTKCWEENEGCTTFGCISAPTFGSFGDRQIAETVTSIKVSIVKSTGQSEKFEDTTIKNGSVLYKKTALVVAIMYAFLLVIVLTILLLILVRPVWLSP